MSDRSNLMVPGKTPTRRQMVFGSAIAFGGLALGSREVWAEAEERSYRLPDLIVH